MPPQPPPLRPSTLRPIINTCLSQRSSHARRPAPCLLQHPPRQPYSTKRTPSPALPNTKVRPNSLAGGGSRAPRTADRGPASKETTQTDFGALDVLASMPPPTTAIDATHPDGFSLNSGIEVTGAGVLLYGGEAFKWRPWVRGEDDDAGPDTTTNPGSDNGNSTPSASSSSSSSSSSSNTTLRDVSGLLWECGRRAWGVLDVAWPKPDLLIIGTGATIVPISPTTRRHINDLGIRLEVADTRNAASQFNLLATERGVNQVAAALVPVGWKEESNRGGVRSRGAR
ncbi:hypothetical protein BKA80DRAFT_269038 [Phyllosticta citrichinensis]